MPQGSSRNRITNKEDVVKAQESGKTNNPSELLQENLFNIQQNPEEITEIHNQKTGEVIPLEMNPNLEREAPAAVLEVHPLQERISHPRAYRDLVLGKDLRILLTNKSSGDQAELRLGSTEKIYNTAIRQTARFVEKNNIPADEVQRYYNDALAIAANVKNIFENATYVLKHRDVKGVNRDIKRYAAAVHVDARPYFVMITVKDNGQMAGVQLYDLQAEHKSALTVISGITRHRQGNNSIDDLVRFVKRKIAKYNNCVSGQGPGVLFQTGYHASAGAYSTRFSAN